MSSESSDDRPAAGTRRGFVTTRWSLVVAAGKSGTDASAQALEELCARYWYPLYAYARRRGHDAEEARDLTQAFFVKLLDKRDLAAADPSRGRFRTFLLSSMKNFLTGEWRREQTLKRGGGATVLPLDFDSAEASYRLEPSHEMTPEALYERRWAMAVLERAVADLQEHYREAGKAELFDALKAYLGGDDEVVPYAELAARLDRSEGSLRTAVSRLRSRWRKRIRELVTETVGAEADVRDELQRLAAAVDAGVTPGR